MKRWINEGIAGLFPGYFSMVMATGALAIAAALLGIPVIPHALLYLNVLIYAALWTLTIIRCTLYFPRVITDATSHSLGPGFFTSVAGTCVLGSQFVVIAQRYDIAAALFAFGVLLWAIVMYTFFTAVTIRKKKPTLAEGINGAWLIAAVATQSISILGTLLAPSVDNGRDILLFFALCMYLLGCMLYLNIITLIFYRFTFINLKYSALTPPYWINMGAVAITTLAGSTLILHRQYWPFLQEFVPFIKGFTLFFWIAGTWWIPLLFILMIWRHIVHRYPLTYEPQFWGMASPLAMYTTGTFQLSKALALPFLMFISRGMIVIAIIAWTLVMIGFIRNHLRNLRGVREARSQQ